mmetsp:Transcript_864/g.2636  ORF Transcript_864/g.2636 Transcript_864/m.2636 type:complete len:310 (+) Transcript_864:1980-2909(+)
MDPRHARRPRPGGQRVAGPGLRGIVRGLAAHGGQRQPRVQLLPGHGGGHAGRGLRAPGHRLPLPRGALARRAHHLPQPRAHNGLRVARVRQGRAGWAGLGGALGPRRAHLERTRARLPHHGGPWPRLRHLPPRPHSRVPPGGLHGCRVSDRGRGAQRTAHLSGRGDHGHRLRRPPLLLLHVPQRARLPPHRLGARGHLLGAHRPRALRHGAAGQAQLVATHAAPPVATHDAHAPATAACGGTPLGGQRRVVARRWPARLRDHSEHTRRRSRSDHAGSPQHDWGGRARRERRPSTTGTCWSWGSCICLNG